MMKTRRPAPLKATYRRPACDRYKPCPVCKACNCRISPDNPLVACWDCLAWLVSENDVLRLMTDAEKDALTAPEQQMMAEIMAFCEWKKRRGYATTHA